MKEQSKYGLNATVWMWFYQLNWSNQSAITLYNVRVEMSLFFTSAPKAQEVGEKMTDWDMYFRNDGMVKRQQPQQKLEPSGPQSWSLRATILHVRCFSFSVHLIAISEWLTGFCSTWRPAEVQQNIWNIQVNGPQGPGLWTTATSL